MLQIDKNAFCNYREIFQPLPPFSAASTIRDDPMVRLDSIEQLSIMLDRICTVVVTSPYFQNELGKVSRVTHGALPRRFISFRTDAGKREAAGNAYDEIMITCTALLPDGRLQNVYISRAYNPFQMFAYSEDRVDGKFYLEMLATDVATAQDRHNLGEVEI